MGGLNHLLSAALSHSDGSRARLAELGEFQVDSFDSMGRAHDAEVVRAVAESESVAQFVEGFFQKTFREEVRVIGHAIKLLVKAVQRDHRAVVKELRFPKDEGQNGDIEVCLGYSQHAPTIGRKIVQEAFEDLGGMILPAQGIKSEVRVQGLRLDRTGNTQASGQSLGEGFEVGAFNSSDRN